MGRRDHNVQNHHIIEKMFRNQQRKKFSMMFIYKLAGCAPKLVHTYKSHNSVTMRKLP
jgi:hypothetical protein